jgi:GDP-D-mannose dehydratase
MMYSAGNASKALRLLGWRAELQMRDVVRLMVEDGLASYTEGAR